MMVSISSSAWAGEDHTALRVRKNRTGEHRWRVDADVVNLVRAMARQMPDMGIAAALNRTGKTTAKGHSWTRTRLATLRNIHGIAVYREGERAERGEATLDEAAETLAVSPATVRRLIVEGALPANQICKGRLGSSAPPISRAPRSLPLPSGEGSMRPELRRLKISRRYP